MAWMTTTVGKLGFGQANRRDRAIAHAQTVDPREVARARAIRDAQRHSIRVRWLRRLLPVAAAMGLSSYVLFANQSVTVGNMTASISGLQLESDRVVMLNPLLEGVTDNTGLYKVTAARAIQNLATPDAIELEEITANLDHPDGRVITMTSDKGQFSTKLQTLELRGKIVVKSSDGMEARLASADVDMKGQQVVSNSPVEVRMPAGRVRSQRLVIDMSKQTMSFRERVRVVLRPDAAQAAEAGQAAAAVTASTAVQGN